MKTFIILVAAMSAFASVSAEAAGSCKQTYQYFADGVVYTHTCIEKQAVRSQTEKMSSSNPKLANAIATSQTRCENQCKTYSKAQTPPTVKKGYGTGVAAACVLQKFDGKSAPIASYLVKKDGAYYFAKSNSMTKSGSVEFQTSSYVKCDSYSSVAASCSCNTSSYNAQVKKSTPEKTAKTESKNSASGKSVAKVKTDPTKTAVKGVEGAPIKEDATAKNDLPKSPVTLQASPKLADKSDKVADAPAKQEPAAYKSVDSDYVKTYKDSFSQASTDRNTDVEDQKIAIQAAKTMINGKSNETSPKTPSTAISSSSATGKAQATSITTDSNTATVSTAALTSRGSSAPTIVEQKLERITVSDKSSLTAAMKTQKSDLRDLQKAQRTQEATDSIVEKNTVGYGGQYGGAKVATTESINDGVKTLSTIASQVMTNSASSQNGAVVSRVQNQGSAATQKAINNGQADMLENTAKTNSTLGISQVVMSAIQAQRIMAHKNSIKNVDLSNTNALTQASEANTAVQEDYKIKVAQCKAMNPIYADKCMAEQDQRLALQKELYATQLDNAKTNQSEEIKAQKAQMEKQMIASATTAAQAALAMKQAASLKAAANALRNQAVADTAGQFSFNPGAVNNNPTPETSAIKSDPSTVFADEGTPNDTTGNDDAGLNPNVAEAGPGGPAAPAFVAQDLKPGSANGGGLASAGGTSPANAGAAGPETSALTKASTGSYSQGEGAGGAKYSRGSGSGAAVGVDSGFADLLKKFLPGGEEEKKPDEAFSVEDRSPASDQAAVLGRNQNIFDAIHKRYQKKHTEGAVVFVVENKS
jgi:hypothetical protein